MEALSNNSNSSKSGGDFAWGYLIIPIAILTILIISGVSSCSEEEKGALGEADNLFNKGKYSAALAEIDKILMANESCAEAYILRGNCHLELAKNAYRMGDQFMLVSHYEDASFSFGQAIRLNENSQEAYFGKLVALANITFEEESPSLIQEAKEKFPNAIDAFKIFEGIEKNRVGDRIGAIADIKASIEGGKISNDEKALALHVLASIYMNQENYTAALNALNDAIAINGKDDIAYAMRGELKDMQGQDEDACADYKRAVDLGYIAKKEMLAYCE